MSSICRQSTNSISISEIDHFSIIIQFIILNLDETLLFRMDVVVVDGRGKLDEISVSVID